MSETVETKLARLEEKIDRIRERLENGDRNFYEFEKRISALERQFYAATIISSIVWAAALIWLRSQLGG